ncbi:MAG: twin-arginine translocase subunit TatC [Synergistaceae bacterium]|nr:twin-arginine translocase subunit TatC [Synergistaceae bacterium]
MDDDWTPHLEELRRRIIVVLIAFFAAAVAAFFFSPQIAAFLTEPLAGVRLYTFAPAEKFMAYLRLSAWTGVVFAAPVFCAETAVFLWPGLKDREFMFVSAALFVVPSLFLLGAALCWRFLAPVVFRFFMSFGEGDNIGAMWGFDSYLSLLFGLMLAAGLLLQAPLLLLALLLTGAVSHNSVARLRPHIVLAIFLLAALLTPPDVISQVMLGVPLYLLFEAALFIGGLLRKANKGDP